MTRKSQSSLEASEIEWLALRNHTPCMAHIIQHGLGTFLYSLGVKGCIKSCEAHERVQQFRENENTEIAKCQRLRKECNAWINKVSAMKPGLPMIIGKVPISTYFEYPKTNLHKSESMCCIVCTGTWLSKRVHWLSNRQSVDRSTTNYVFEVKVKLHTGVAWVGQPIKRIHLWVAQLLNIPWLLALSTQHKINGPSPSMAWMSEGHSGIVRRGCLNSIRQLCITVSLSTITCSIIWMAVCELQLRSSLNGRKTYTLTWSWHTSSCPNIMPQQFLWQVCVSFQQISLILSGSCDLLQYGIKDWIWILRMRFLILPNTRRHFRSIWGTNEEPNIGGCQTWTPTVYQPTIYSLLQLI